MASKPRLLVVAQTGLANDPRPYKQTSSLKEYFEITELAFSPSGNADHFVLLRDIPHGSPAQKLYWAATLLAGLHKPYLSRYTLGDAEVWLREQAFDLVIAHDVTTCPLAFDLAGSAPVIIDLHEYLPRQHEDSLRWRLFFQRAVSNLCREYLPRAAALLTPCEGLADEYTKEFNVQATVNYNAPPFADLLPSATEGKEHVELVHHGIIAPGRYPECMFELMDQLDERFRLHLYMIGDGTYAEKIRQRALEHPRVVWHDPVPMLSLARTLNPYDIGLFMLPANTFNHDAAIANKFFEFVQARLAVAVWPTKGMAPLVARYGLGVSTPKADVASMAEALNALTPAHITACKNNSHAAASVFTGESSAQIIMEVVRSVVPAAFVRGA